MVLVFHSSLSVYLGPVSTSDNRILKGPLGRSLRSFARTAHSLHSAPLRYTRFAHSLHSRARSLTSLTPSWDIWNSWICVHAEIAFKENKPCLKTWVYGKGRQGHWPTPLFVGLTPLSDLNQCRKSWQKMKKRMKETENRSENAYSGEEWKSICGFLTN